MKTFGLPHLSSIKGLRHIFVGRAREPRPDPATLTGLLDNRSGAGVARLRQVHSNRCLRVDHDTARPDGLVGEGDALATSSPGLMLAVATADCLPLIAVDPAAGALAVVHAGWRGTLAGVLPMALERMRDDLGARPERILIGAGPAVGACCYQVGAEVIEAFTSRHPAHIKRIASARPEGVTHLDLLEANSLQALDAGVDPANIVSVGICTVCQPDLTHSYRREGDRAGRMWTLAMLVDPATRPAS